MPGLYLYASETKTFPQFLSDLRNDDPAIASRIVDARPLLSLATGYTFMAYTPSYGDNRFAFSRPNNAFAASFRIQ